VGQTDRQSDGPVYQTTDRLMPPFWWRWIGLISQCGLCRLPRPTFVPKYPSGILIHVQPYLTTIDMCPFWGAGSPSNRMSPCLRPPSLPNDILIHAAVWPQLTPTPQTDRQTDRCTNTDKQDRTDNGSIAPANRFTNSRPKKSSWSLC